MPTMPPPVATTTTMKTTQTPPPAPPKPSSSSQQKKANEAIFGAVLFFGMLLILCGLLGVFLFRSYGKGNLYKTNAPVLKELPAFTAKSAVSVEGTAAKNASITITLDSGEVITTKADKKGNFIAVAELKKEGKTVFAATAVKKFLFLTATSSRSNEVSTIYDKSAPNMKLTALPNTVNAEEYTIKGNISEPAQVTIKLNDKEVTVDTDADNNFSAKVNFVKGSNSVTVIAKDNAGNETASATAIVTYSILANGSRGSSGTASANGALPNSAGPLDKALSTVFGRYVAIMALVVGAFGFVASSSFVWLLKAYKTK
jgi:hypothetical protein